MTQPLPTLTPSEARKLSGFLRSEKTSPETLTFNQLKGYLLSICCTPAFLQPSVWLPEVFGGEMPAFESEQNLWVIEAVMKLYNQINAEVLEGNPKLPANCKIVVGVSNNFKLGNALHEWCWGFDLGLGLTMKYWDDFPLPAELEEEIECYWMLLSFFADEKRARAAKVKGEASLPFDEMLEVVRAELPWLIKDYAVIGRMLYEVTLKEEEGGNDYQRQLSLSLQEEKEVDDNVIPFWVGSEHEAPALLRAAYNATPEEKVRLARQAVRKDPNCVDAYLILADFASQSIEERKQLLEQAVIVGEQALGQRYFQENSGRFWGLQETRPYMTALAELAEACKNGKDKQRAVALYEQGLQLNPGDHQGLRYPLSSLYLELHKFSEIAALFEQYKEDRSAFFCYNRLLMAYILEGDSPDTRHLKRRAKEHNRYIPNLLAGQLKMPKELPGFYGVGNKDEAVLYVYANRHVWRQVMGSISWLLKK